jgi:putative aminopeptidase FrvX
LKGEFCEAKRMKSFIKKLVETPAPSGYESQVRDLVKREIEALVDELYVDRLGNLIARKGAPEPNGLKVMLAAHLDEVGLAATHIDEQGFVRFLPVGALSPLTCLGSRVQFLSGATGVIGAERLADENKTPTFEQLFIDLGWSSRAECPVRVGDEAVFVQPFVDLGERLVGKALDDRVGVALLVEVLRQMHEKKIQTPHGLFFVFSVQEQVGARGAITAAYGVDPDLGIAVDATPSGDTPAGYKLTASLGKGPAIRVRDGSTLFDASIVDWMVGTAEAARLPYQLEVVEKEYTGGRAIQLSHAGVPVGCLSLPCRYLHTASEMVDYQDLQNGVRLMLELLHKPFLPGRG